jgi:hypothetical protein
MRIAVTAETAIPGIGKTARMAIYAAVGLSAAAVDLSTATAVTGHGQVSESTGQAG